MVLRVISFNMEDCPVGKIVVIVHYVCPVLYRTKIICNRMLRTWPMLEVEIEFLEKQHPPGQFLCLCLIVDEVEERHVVQVKCELFS